MINKLFYLSLIVVFAFGLTFAQDVKDRAQKPQSFDNPLMVSGPALEGPLAEFYESFEGGTFPPAGWVKYNPDAGTGWEKITAGTTPLPGWNGGDATPAPVAGSGTGMAYATWTTGGAASNDQWLVSPQIGDVQAEDTLKFWMRKFSDLYLDNVDVLISTTGNQMADFTTTVENITYAATDTGWVEYTYVLGDFVSAGSNIYIAWREHVLDNFNDGAAIFLDEVRIVSGGGGGGGGFTLASDDFDSYTAGTGVAQQNGSLWQTWSNQPGGPEDPLVSNAQSSTSPNSLVIMPSNDVFTLLGTLNNPTTYVIEFNLYIPTGKAGYFNTLAISPAGGTTTWAMQVRLNVGGSGDIDAGGAASAIFNYPNDEWFPIRIEVDIVNDLGSLWIDEVFVHSWTYTTGTFGTAGSAPLQIQSNNFFGATANDEMYVDDYRVSDVIPVELTSFTANVNPSGHVVLNWSTASELNNQMFEIERRVEDGQFYRIGYVEGFGTTSEPQDYSYVDNSVSAGTYYYRLKQIDFNGTFEYFNEVMVDVNGPLGFDLSQNYPNPFNPSTSIAFNIAEPTMVKLAVYNLLGEKVQNLVNEFMQPGFYNVNFNAANLPSGMYIYKLETATYTQARKMMLMK